MISCPFFVLHQGLTVFPLCTLVHTVHRGCLFFLLSIQDCLSTTYQVFWQFFLLLDLNFPLDFYLFPLVLLSPLKSAFLITVFHAVVKTSVRLIAFRRVSFRNCTMFSIRLMLTSWDCISLLTSTVTYIWKIK